MIFNLTSGGDGGGGGGCKLEDVSVLICDFSTFDDVIVADGFINNEYREIRA